MTRTITVLTFLLVLVAPSLGAQSTNFEARINELEAALDHLQERIEKLERRQTPTRMSEAEAEAVLRKKHAEDECTAQLGPAPEFAPVLGTKVNLEYMVYLKKHRAGRGPRSTGQTLSTETWSRRAVVVDVHRARKGQPVERRPISLRVDDRENPLGDGGHGSVHSANHRAQCSGGRARWTRSLPSVQLGDRPDRDPTSPPQQRSRSAVRIPPLESQPESSGSGGGQERTLRAFIASVR